MQNVLNETQLKIQDLAYRIRQQLPVHGVCWMGHCPTCGNPSVSARECADCLTSALALIVGIEATKRLVGHTTNVRDAMRSSNAFLDELVKQHG